MSSVEIAGRINPMGNPIKLKDEMPSAPVSDSNGSDKIDFRSLIGNSNYELEQDKKAKSKGDLSGAKSNEELFNSLNLGSEKKDAPKNKMDKDDFLKLFIAQLQNQDPLKPKEDYEMASQLAQFNGLEQMLNVNKKLEDLANLQKNAQSITMIDYVGKEVTVDGGKVRFVGGAPQNVSYKLDQPISNAVLEVRDSSGSVVATSDVGNLMDGQHKLNTDIKKKDGTKLNDGIYTLTLSTTDAQKVKSEIPLTVSTEVTGVNLKAGDGSFYTSIGELKGSELVSVGTKGFMKDEVNKPRIKANSDANSNASVAGKQKAGESDAGAEKAIDDNGTELGAASEKQVLLPDGTSQSGLPLTSSADSPAKQPVAAASKSESTLSGLAPVTEPASAVESIDNSMTGMQSKSS